MINFININIFNKIFQEIRIKQLEEELARERNEKETAKKQVELLYDQLNHLIRNNQILAHHQIPEESLKENQLSNTNLINQSLMEGLEDEEEGEDMNITSNMEEINSFLTNNVFNKLREHNVELELNSLEKIKEEIMDFFIKRAEAINELIDKQLEVEAQMEKEENESLKQKLKLEYDKIDNDISEIIKNNHKEFDESIRYKIQDFLALSRQEAENIKFREHELISWCADLFKSVCVDKKE